MTQIEGLTTLPDRMGTAAADYAAYWARLPKSGGVPFKRALDPGAMRKFVASFVIVERHSRREFTWRLVGSAVRDLSGTEMTGTDAFAAHSAAQREKAMIAYNAQLDTPCGVWGVTIVRSAGGTEMPIEVMVLPLRADDGEMRFLANTVVPWTDRSRYDRATTVDMQVLSWPEHRFIDIGFGVPKLRPDR